jgi:uncharacterized membrane protein
MDEQNPTNQAEHKEETKSGSVVSVKQEDRNIALLSYLFLLVLIPLLTKRENEFVMFHAKQGIVLAIVWFIAPFTFILAPLFYLFSLIMSIMGIMNVMAGKKQELPLIGKFASKFDF